jgi:pyrrolysine biosynthesis protein PylC
VPEFFGADEALTNYREGARAWVATLVVGGRTRRNAEQRLEKVLGTIRRRFSLDAIVDRYPEMVP